MASLIFRSAIIRIASIMVHAQKDVIESVVFVIWHLPTYLVTKMVVIIIYTINFTSLSILYLRMAFFKLTYWQFGCSLSMVKTIKIFVFVLIVCCLATAVPFAETIYTWTDENGIRHMTNIPPSKTSGKVELMQLKPAPPVTSSPPVQQKALKTEVESNDVTPISLYGNHVIVPTTLIVNDTRIVANLLLDTGSTNIALHKKTADKLAIKDPPKGYIQVAGGKLIEAEVVKLKSVTVGTRTRQNLYAGIIEHHGKKVPYDGLLGMNFLKNFEYTIDFDKKIIRWIPE